MSKLIHCQNCGQDFEQRENELCCPTCGQLIGAEDVKLTSLAKALAYVDLWRGRDALKRGGLIRSILADLMSSHGHETRLVARAYSAAEAEIGALVVAASSSAASDAARRLAEALFRAYVSRDYTDKFVSALLEALGLDTNRCLSGADHPAVQRLRHGYDVGKLRSALGRLDLQANRQAWRDGGKFAGLLLEEAPKLTEEAELVRYTIELSGGKFWTLRQAVSAGKDQEELSLSAAIRKDLRDAFMDDGDIRAGTEALFAAMGAGSTAGAAMPSAQNWPSTQPSAPSRPGTKAQGKVAGPGHGSTPAQTAQGGLGAQAGQTAQSGFGAQIGQSAWSGFGAQTGASSVTVQSPVGGKSRKRCFTKKRIILSALALYLVFLYLILPGFRSLTRRVRSLQYQREEEAREREEALATPSPEPTEAPPLTIAERYPAPEVRTSAAQVGVYQIGNIASPSTYRSYEGPDAEFSFRYPGVLYADVDYLFEGDGEEIEIEFYCGEDDSDLLVETYPCEEAITQELKDHMMVEAMGGLLDAEVLADRQMMAGTLADTRSQHSYLYYIKGLDAQKPEVVQYELVRLSSGSVKRMRLRIPAPTSEEDRAFKEYYAQVMYDLCAFGGNTEYTAWRDFKKKYSF